MKNVLITALLLLLSMGTVLAQKTQGPYTVWVYNTNASCAQTTLLTSNSQLLANTTYIVKVRTTTSPNPSMLKIDNADGYDTGLFGICPFSPRPDPTAYREDIGAFNNYTITFIIKTKSAPDFASPVYMRVQHSFDSGSTWGGTQHITFPY